MSDDERVTISDALDYIQKRTGYAFTPRQFRLWLEAGLVTLDGRVVEIVAHTVEGRWYVNRTSLDSLIAKLLE